MRCLASLLDVEDDGLGRLIDKEVKADLRQVWTPTAENFFARVGGPTLDALWCELLELAPEHPTATTFAKLKKREKAEKLEALFADPMPQQPPPMNRPPAQPAGPVTRISSPGSAQAARTTTGGRRSGRGVAGCR